MRVNAAYSIWLLIFCMHGFAKRFLLLRKFNCHVRRLLQFSIIMTFWKKKFQSSEVKMDVTKCLGPKYDPSALGI